MSWPVSQDYNEAIQTPRQAFTDPDLQWGQCVPGPLGIPMPRSGNFADVYELRGETGRWAVKCFTREVRGLASRYQAVGEFLRQAKLPFMVGFTFLEQGIRVGGAWYPILKMPWIEGLLLNDFVRAYVIQPPILRSLARIWLQLARALRKAEMTHGDLQHGNILLVPGAKSLALKLIDYDGLIVPALAKQPTGEMGHPNYQHPERIRQGYYGSEVDRLALLSVYVALRALGVDGQALWDRYDQGSNLLFRHEDFVAPNQSPLFQELLRSNDKELVALVNSLAAACQGPLRATPWVQDLVSAQSAQQEITQELRALDQPTSAVPPPRRAGATEVGWFVKQEERVLGPLTAADLKNLAVAGLLQAEALLWPDGADPGDAVAACAALDFSHLAAIALPAPDWLSDVPQSTTAPTSPPLKSGGLPDWLGDVQAQEPRVPAPAPPSTGLPDWLQEEIHAEAPSISLDFATITAVSVPAPSPPLPTAQPLPPLATPLPLPVAVPLANRSVADAASVGKAHLPIATLLTPRPLPVATPLVELPQATPVPPPTTKPPDFTGLLLAEVYQKALSAIHRWADEDHRLESLTTLPPQELHLQAQKDLQLDRLEYFGKELVKKVLGHLAQVIDNRRRYYQAMKDRGQRPR